MQRPRDLPTAQVSARRAPPVVRRKPMPGSADLPCHGLDHLNRTAAFSRGELGRKLRVIDFQRFDEFAECNLALRMNENFIAGSIQGQRLLSVKYNGKTVPLQFTLYVAPQEKG